MRKLYRIQRIENIDVQCYLNFRIATFSKGMIAEICTRSYEQGISLDLEVTYSFLSILEILPLHSSTFTAYIVSISTHSFGVLLVQ